ncbi:MAG: hypothetical protein ACI3Z0_06625 [Candidatus Cryptobacteroides sp.]
MNSVDFNLELLDSLFSSDNAFREMVGMVNDLGLELQDISIVKTA